MSNEPRDHKRRIFLKQAGAAVATVATSPVAAPAATGGAGTVVVKEVIKNVGGGKLLAQVTSVLSSAGLGNILKTFGDLREKLKVGEADYKEIFENGVLTAGQIDPNKIAVLRRLTGFPYHRIKDLKIGDLTNGELVDEAIQISRVKGVDKDVLAGLVRQLREVTGLPETATFGDVRTVIAGK